VRGGRQDEDAFSKIVGEAYSRRAGLIR
jgi:hypothetical protein